MTETASPDTVVLVHGLWGTPRSWENWVQRYQSRGLTVLTPAYPGTVDHLARVIEQVSNPPIIMGHSFGGTLTQLLLARGLGCAGVVGEQDHIMPPSVNRSNAKHYDKSPAITDYHEFDGRDH